VVISERPRRNHVLAFKVKVALDTLKGERTLTEWKIQFLEHTVDVFSKVRKTDQGPSVQDLHAKIGHLSMENNCLSR
jgi:transposase